MLELLIVMSISTLALIGIAGFLGINRWCDELDQTVKQVRSDADEFDRFVEQLSREEHANGYTLCGRYQRPQ
jgi:hypothetical protein